jgi:methyl-accepting chemotaxis protein
MFKNLTIGKKIGLTVGVLVLILLAVGLIAVFGINGIVNNADQVIEGNKLRAEMTQREVDHLQWAATVSDFLSDRDVHELEVELDHTQCALGRWYYAEDGTTQSEKVDRAVALVPSLQEPLDALEAPHRHLHESAQEIEKVYREADPDLPILLGERKNDHLAWAATIRDAFLEQRGDFGVQLDPTKCRLGQWITDRDAWIQAHAGAAFRESFNTLKEKHRKLHESARVVEEQLAFGELQTAQQREETLRATLQREAQTLFAALERAMEGVVDPAKEKAYKSADIAAITRWSTVDETMNEALVKRFLVARVELADLARDHSAENISEAREAIDRATAGLETWAELAAAQPGLAETVATVRRIGATWSETATEYTDITETESRALQAVAQSRRAFETTTLPLLEQNLALLENLQGQAEQDLEGLQKARAIYADQTTTNLGQVQTHLHEIISTTRENIMTDEEMLSAARTTQWEVGVIALLGILGGSVLAVIIGRGLVTTLVRIIGGLNQGADEVHEASGQVSNASQQLAEGATEQAASLEETSSALEEMASMTRQNADNAKNANGLADEARQAAEQGSQSMDEMQKAMGAINDSSEEIGKIIKVIEEIAFQTNLLALNAAVEAARAGDAGKGFAVVADEVRNLAQRSAEAAKDTNELIATAVERAENGTRIANESGEALEQIVGQAQKVAELIAEISQASDEQAQGVDQVNTAVAQMDKVTQSNAANAEESASASEELAAQAEQLNEAVGELARMVGGQAQGDGHAGRQALPGGRRQPARRQVGAAQGGNGENGRTPTVVKPDQVIPFDEESGESEENFRDF